MKPGCWGAPVQPGCVSRGAAGRGVPERAAGDVRGCRTARYPPRGAADGRPRRRRTCARARRPTSAPERASGSASYGFGRSRPPACSPCSVAVTSTQRSSWPASGCFSSRCSVNRGGGAPRGSRRRRRRQRPLRRRCRVPTDASRRRRGRGRARAPGPGRLPRGAAVPGGRAAGALLRRAHLRRRGLADVGGRGPGRCGRGGQEQGGGQGGEPGQGAGARAEPCHEPLPGCRLRHARQVAREGRRVTTRREVAATSGFTVPLRRAPRACTAAGSMCAGRGGA